MKKTEHLIKEINMSKHHTKSLAVEPKKIDESQKQEQTKEHTVIALTKAMFTPVAGLTGPAKVPRVTILGRGLFKINKEAIKQIAAQLKLEPSKDTLREIYLGWDETERELQISPKPWLKSQEDAQSAMRGRYSEKTSELYSETLTSLFEKVLHYDVKASGDQTFEAKIENGVAKILLPLGSLVPREKTRRVPKSTINQTGEPVDSSVPTSVAPQSELVLS